MLLMYFPVTICIVKYQDMNRAALSIRYSTRETLEKLLSLLQSAPVERDRFVAHLFQSRRAYRRACETAGKSGKQIERCVISTFQIAESIGFKGEFRHWQDSLRD
jgi:hypothetical protein